MFSACSCFGLAAVSTWFASERWIFNRHKGKKWLADALSDTKIRLYSIPGVGWAFTQPRAAARKVAYWSRRQSKDAGDFFNDVSRKTANVLRSVKSSRSDVDELDRSAIGSPLPESMSPEPMSPVTPFYQPTNPLMPIAEVDSRPRSLDISDEKTVLSDGGSTIVPSTPLPNPAARSRWANAVKSVTVMLRSTSAASGAFSMPNSPKRQRTMSSEGSRGAGKTTDILPGMMKASRVAALVPKLKSLETTQDLAAHQALVRHLQFSPNGQFLATSR